MSTSNGWESNGAMNVSAQFSAWRSLRKTVMRYDISRNHEKLTIHSQSCKNCVKTISMITKTTVEMWYPNEKGKSIINLLLLRMPYHFISICLLIFHFDILLCSSITSNGTEFVSQTRENYLISK